MRIKLLSALSLFLLPHVAASASDMPYRMNSSAQLAPDWSGFSVGAHLGGAFDGRTKITGSDNFTLGGNSGLILGGQVGFDYQFNSLVFGAAIDLGTSSVSKKHELDTTLTVKTPYIATLRARTGIALNPWLMLYVTSGFATTTQAVTATRSGLTSSQAETLQGYVIGVGAEYKISNSMSSFIEYRHTKYLHENYPIFDSKRLDFGQSEIRAGINYRFGQRYLPRIAAHMPTRWSGPYMGLHTGYGFDGRSKVTRGDDVVLGGNSGALFGVQVGYDQQVGDIVLGIVSDIDSSTSKNTHQWDTTITIKTPYTGTFRGRIGYLITPDTLIYSTAGYATTEQHLSTSTPRNNESQSKRLGGIVIGMGGEYLIRDNLSSFIEYRRTKYLHENYPAYGELRLDYMQSEIRLGLNYRLAQSTQSSIDTKKTSWTGSYLGINLGHAYDGRSKVTRGDDVILGGNKGYLAGGQIGYDYQTWHFVYGIATDLAVSNTEKTHHWDTTITVKTPYNMTARARTGYVLNSNLMTYVTGGYAQTNHEIYTQSLSEQKGQSKNLRGRVLGFGAEYRLTDHVSTFAEYRHFRYLKENYPTYETLRLNYQQSEIRMGFNYRY